MTFSLESYRQLLQTFLGAQYRFASFQEYDAERCILLRHDVDFSTSDALKLAELENSLGIRSTYFFLLTTEFYNLSTPACRRDVERIRELGGRLSLHFDPTAYSDLDKGFALERSAFESLFGEQLQIISLHRPRDFLSTNGRRLEGVRHTYEDAYFKDMCYISDSGGSFRFGAPLESEAFRTGQTIHLNLHPIWWVRSGALPSDKLRNWQQQRFTELNHFVAENCLSFDGRPFWAN